MVSLITDGRLKRLKTGAAADIVNLSERCTRCCTLDDLRDDEHILGKGAAYQAELKNRVKEAWEVIAKAKAV